jgi:REP element-mobilizing transposase RayT
MPQSLSKVILYIIFSTKNREPWLDSNMRARMHAYLATICRDLGAEFVHVGGSADHVHIVTTLPRTLSQAQLIEQIKKPSSKWIKALDARYRGFFWQRWCVFSEPESARACAAIHRLTSICIGISGGIPRVAAGTASISMSGVWD